MDSIAFIDTEIEPRSGKILDLGGVRNNGERFHQGSVKDFVTFLHGVQYVGGHNLIRHDWQYVGATLEAAGLSPDRLIDTLYLSPLLFPTKPYHALLKDDKLQTEELNNPLNDALKARELFQDEVGAFYRLDEVMRRIFYGLLRDQKEFKGFFIFVNYRSPIDDLQGLIRERFQNEICEQVELRRSIADHPIALAYALSLIDSFAKHQQLHSITPPWVLHSYPEVERILFRLRNTPCWTGCRYCDRALDIRQGLKRHFGFEAYRTFGGVPLQERAVQAAMDHKSMIAVFPTGGGKSITFQVPALISGETTRALTVVISPLQSLMKDQVDNLERLGITQAVTINGLLDPIERAKAMERVADGSAFILYISPESLRSKTIERLILGRKIARFVIDEAHCFSAWGQDFRVDYMYIGDFIQRIREMKHLDDDIPVSCFTATAKQQVIEDIRAYFREKLALELELYTTKEARTNLTYQVFSKEDEEAKYLAVRDLIEAKACPTIIYVSRTRKAYALADRLTKDGFEARPYHGKMDKLEKSENQDAFIAGEVPIMVATSAFGMGVDKKDVGMVIHYEISDSLENYVQEAGRAGRDQSISADCFVLFNEEDLSKHFILLNQTKLSIKEIQQVWKAIKDITRLRSTVSQSALEIARKAGWDTTLREIETRVTTAIAALEEAGYLKRGQNMPRIYADSIQARNVEEAVERINASRMFTEPQKEQATRIIKKLISSRSRSELDKDAAESRIDYMSDQLGIVKEEVILLVNLLREEKILADAKDLTAFIKRGENANRSLKLVELFIGIENQLLPWIDQQERVLSIKELNEALAATGLDEVNASRIRTVLNFWSIKNWVRRQAVAYSNSHVGVVALHPPAKLKVQWELRHELARFFVTYLYEKSRVGGVAEAASSEVSDVEGSRASDAAGSAGTEVSDAQGTRASEMTGSAAQDTTGSAKEVLVEFSVHELKQAFENSLSSFGNTTTIADVEDALFYLSRIEAIKIEGGFLVLYNGLTIQRLEENNKKSYTKEDYKRLGLFYENKVQQIHIVGEYAKKMLVDYQEALQFVEDYFQLNYPAFLRKYFPGSKVDELRLRMTPRKFKQLFGELSPTQLKIIKDNETPYMVVAAGPGSGKTRVLVHKLASLLLMEDVKHEQLLMVTFSRAAANEFKRRLQQLIGNAAQFVEIKTFHSYCFDLLGQIGTLEKSGDILRRAIEKIQRREVEISRITKTVLVIDESQDMDQDEFDLVTTLMNYNEDMRVIAVGDDDQNIYEFRGADSKYLEQLIHAHGAVKHELIENYRSKANLVDFTNQFLLRLRHRLKHTPIIAHQTDLGRIQIVRHPAGDLITPLVNNIRSAPLTGTTCVLTSTNDEALQITGQLLHQGIPARLIQSNDGFSLINLREIRCFLGYLDALVGAGSVGGGAVTNAVSKGSITDECWQAAKDQLSAQFSRSTILELCQNLLRDFEATHPWRKYRTDLEVFIRESRPEDFYGASGTTVLVSTIHKSKGKEFDHVFLLLDNFIANTDAEKRRLYVAMTRAKSDLSIHLNCRVLDGLTGENLTIVEDPVIHSAPKELVTHLTLKDLWLDYFLKRQDITSSLVAGDPLTVQGHECLDPQGRPVLHFSKHYIAQLERMKHRGYIPIRARVNVVIYWMKDGSPPEVPAVLPEVVFGLAE